MEKLFIFALAIAVSLGTTAMLANSARVGTKPPTIDALLANDAAYRDGLFVGKLAARQGRTMRPLIGRWSSQKDRVSFVMGYERGYNEVVSARQ
jgi:hypothetical protein